MRSFTTTTRPVRRRIARTVIGIAACGVVLAFSAPSARADAVQWEDARKECLGRKPTGGLFGKTFNLKQCCLILLSDLEPRVDDVRCWAEKPRSAVPRIPPLPPIPGVRRRPTTTVPATVPTTAPVSVTTAAGSPGIAVGGGQPGSPVAGQIDPTCPSEGDRAQLEQLLKDRTAQVAPLVRVVRVSGSTKPAAQPVRLQAWVDLDELQQQISDLNDALARSRSGTVCAAFPAAPPAGGTGSAPPPATLPKDPATGRDVLPTTEVTIDWNVSLRSLPFKYSAAYTFRCPPLTDPRQVGQVIGTDLYSGYSSICGAAVHAGKIGFGGGTVTVTGEQVGPKSYTGSARNGIRSVSQAFEAPTVMTFS